MFFPLWLINKIIEKTMWLSLLIILHLFLANETVFRDSWGDLNCVFQKVICYQHHYDNCQESLDKNIILFSMLIKKPPAIKSTSTNFYTACNWFFYNTKEKLVELLEAEREKMVNILQNQYYETVKFIFPIELDEIVFEIERKKELLKNTIKA